MLNFKTIDTRFSELLSKLSVETYVQAYKDVHSKNDIKAYCNDNYSVSSTESLLKQSDVEAVIAFEEESSAGFYVIKHHQCPIKLDGQATELKQIYILSSHFGSGLGGKLFNNSIERALEKESKWLWLCVSDINYRAQGFYKKLGFKQIGDGPQLMVGGDALSSSIMSLNIDTKMHKAHQPSLLRDWTA